MNVIRHHHPVTQKVTLPLKVQKAPNNQLCDLWAPQMTCTRPLVEIAFHFAPEVATDMLL